MALLVAHPVCSPYQTLLGDAFAVLHPAVQRAHLVPLVAEGLLDVEHGRHWLVPLFVRVLRLPAAGRGQRVSVTVASSASGITWSRQIGRSPLRTVQRAVHPYLVECHGLGRIAFALDATEGALVYRQVAIGVPGVMLSTPLLPQVRARVSGATEGWRVDVAVTWRGHLVCRYHGQVHAR